MNKRGQIVAEILLGLILIVLLIILILLFGNLSATGKTTSSDSKSNTINIYNVPQKQYCETIKTPYKYIGELSHNYVGNNKMNLKYSSHAVYESSDIEIDKYIVYVKNRDYETGYFTVEFYFENYYADEVSYLVSYYLKPNEEKKFIYRDFGNKYEHYDWRYKVIPGAKIVSERGYNYEPVKYKIDERCY